MRSCCALYVDAGYLLAAAASRVAGTSLRGSVDVDHGVLIEGLIAQATAVTGLPVMRVCWYDCGGARGGQPCPEQARIGELPRVKLRLGRRSPAGEQKGVDLRLGLDLVTDAQGPTVDVALLVSGDDDLTEAVEEAQRHGMEVSVLAVPDRDGVALGVARHLRQEADELLIIEGAVIDGAVRRTGHAVTTEAAELTASGSVRVTPAVLGARPGPRPPAEPETPRASMPRPQAAVFSTSTGVPLPPVRDEVDDDAVAAAVDDVARRVAGSWAVTATPADRARVRAARPHVPADIDRALLLDLVARMGVDELDDGVRVDVRAAFWRVVEQVAAA